MFQIDVPAGREGPIGPSDAVRDLGRGVCGAAGS
jgi:hypothetical protein